MDPSRIARDTMRATVYGTELLDEAAKQDKDLSLSSTYDFASRLAKLGAIVVTIFLITTIAVFEVRSPQATSIFQQPTFANTGVTLVLLRHAKSSWKDDTLDDFDRPLKGKGRKAAIRLGKFLRSNHAAEPDIIYSSPAARTRETISLVQTNWATKSPIEYDQKLFDGAFNASDYVTFIDNLQLLKHRKIMIVGHNPAIEDLAKHIDNSIIHFPTAGYCEFHWNSWGEIWTVEPIIELCTAHRK